ncbi:hypothetical protein EON65_16155 [archaeon]|nr:MAG: hypothetical protein EON65_16155 [archaeon]
MKLDFDADEKVQQHSDDDEKGDKVDNDGHAPLSTTKRKLLEAKQRDAFFDKEVKAVETSQIVRTVSQTVVTQALSTAITYQLSPAKNSKK